MLALFTLAVALFPQASFAADEAKEIGQIGSKLYLFHERVTETAGAYFTQPQARPHVQAGTWSLAELVVSPNIPQSNAIEFGWIVYPGGGPHLFLATRQALKPLCTVLKEGDCDFHQTKDARYLPYGHLHSSVEPDKTVRYYVGHYKTAWWIFYKDQWIGTIGDSHWSPRFQRAATVWWYGEVGTFNGTQYPCTDMGNGKAGTENGSASISGMFYGGKNGIQPAPARLYSDFPPNRSPGWTRKQTGPDAFTYGGHGYC